MTKTITLRVNGTDVKMDIKDAIKLIGITATNAYLEKRCAENVKKEMSASTTTDF